MDPDSMLRLDAGINRPDPSYWHLTTDELEGSHSPLLQLEDQNSSGQTVLFQFRAMPNGPISLPRRTYDPSRLCLISLPKIDLGSTGRKTGVHVSGALFAAGWWIFIDACMLSATMKPSPAAPFDPVPVHVRFSDWIPGLCSSFGMAIVNLIDKKRLLSEASEGFSFSGEDSVVWKARLLLFVGFALLAGGLAGSITVLVLKYVIPDWGPQSFTYWGVANVLQNLAIMLCTIILWITQNTEEYEYALS